MADRANLDQQFQQRLTQQQNSFNQSRTAGSNERQSTSDENRLVSDQNRSRDVRLDPFTQRSAAGIRSGREREEDEDILNVEQNSKLNNAVLVANRSEATNPQRSQDLTRARQNLQRRCNHTYSVITNRCNICNKHRDSHVYDPV